MIPIKGVIAITVKMAVAQAQAALQNLRTQVVGMQSTLNSVNAASNAMAVAQGSASKTTSTLGQRLAIAGKNAMKSASQFQWYSRQLMYNVGLPLLLVGTYATKWALETEAAMVKVSKVYGNLGDDQEKNKKELSALAGYFEAVSNRYGMLQKNVIEIGAAWAAAGARGLGLAKATKLSVETMILGEMNAEEATSALIAIQEAWRLSASDLQKTIADLNLVENQTAVTMQGLIEAFVRTGSAARVAGLTTGDLAALIAGLVPAAGNATVAGNSLKTILSRLAAPTAAAKRAFKEMGINIESTSWQSMSARDQLEKLSKAFERNSKTGQLRNKTAKQMIATDIAGRQQYNRFIQLMDALSDKTSAYWTAQEALRKGKEKINGVTYRQIQYERELNQVLESNPQQFKIVLAQLQNMAIKGIAPLIPYMISFLGYVKQAAEFLGNLPPAAKQLIAALVGISLAITLLSKLASPFILLGGMIARLVPLVVEFGGVIVSALATPWGIAIAAIVAAVAILINWFPDTWAALVKSVVNIWNGFIAYMSDSTNIFGKIVAAIINAYYALPESVRKAMQAVVDIVASAAKAVYELFSYLNPFAHHSPSLVENVTKGMSVILKAFGEIVDIETPINKAYASIKKFKDLMASFRNGKAVDLEFADDLKNIKAVNPKALSTAKEMVSEIKELQKLLDPLSEELTNQQQVVDKWQAKLDDANNTLKVQQDILDGLSNSVSYYQGLIDDAKSAISDYADASITGMQALADETEANTEAQNKLKLAMAQMEAAGSAGFDSLADRMAALNGEFENLVASRSDLVKAGAGSDILQYYDQQISAIEDQKKSIYGTSDAYTQMSQQLSDLEKQADVLDLTKAVNFDPLTYQIDKLADAKKELSFDDIVTGIKNAQASVETYTPKLEEVTAAYNNQKTVVDSLTQARDSIQTQYDTESAILDKIKAKYDSVKDAIDALKDALSTMGTAASSANSSLSSGGVSGGGYPQGAGTSGKKSVGISGMETGTADDIKKAMENLKKITDGMDLTKPIREAWEGAMKWWADNIQPAVDTIGAGIRDAFGTIGQWFVDNLGPKSQVGKVLGNLFGDDFQTAWNEFAGGIQDFITNSAPGWNDFWKAAGPALQGVWQTVLSILEVVGTIIAVIIKVLLYLWNSIIRPLLSTLGTVVGYLMDAIGGVIDFFSELFNTTDDPITRFNKLGHAFGEIVVGILGAIVSLIKGVLAIILNLLVNLGTEIWQTFSNFFPDLAKSISDWFNGLMNIPWIHDFVTMVQQAFTDLWNFLLGHSIIPDIVNGIIKWFTNLVKWATKPFTDLWDNITKGWEDLKKDLGKIVNKILKVILPDDLKKKAKELWEKVTGAISTVWNTLNTTIGGIIDGIKKTITDAPTNIKNTISGLWDAVSKAISDPINAAKDAISSAITTISNLIQSLTGISVPDLWKQITGQISNPVSTAATNVASNITSINGSIQSLNPSIPKDWASISDDISGPIKAAKKAIEAIKLDTSDITGPINKIKSAADDAGDKVQRLIDKLTELATKKYGLATGGAIGTINTSTSFGTFRNGGSIPSFGTAGAVRGAGTGTSDSILSWLSNGEHVLTAREVQKLGGQASVYALRAFIANNNVNAADMIAAWKTYGITRNANGGDPFSTKRSSGSSSATAMVSNTKSEKTVIIKDAHFEFPNIKTASDAKEFMDNLENLL